MGSLLLWLSWRQTQPEDYVWAGLLARAQQRSRFAGEERAGPGYRLYAARTRYAEPSVVLKLHASDGSEQILLLDRANGANDSERREDMTWPDSRLGDGTPTASIRLCPSSLQVQLYRDLMGQRKLVFARVAGGLIVASGEDVLCAHPEVSGELDPMFLAAYFAALSPAPGETVFRDIRQLGSGETITMDSSGERRKRTVLEPDCSWQGMRDAAIVERFAELLHGSVANACRGARRIGISLSAGLDSSSIAAVASRLPRLSGGRIVAVTQGFDQFPEIDERDKAASLAGQLDIEHQSFPADHLLPYSDPALRPICPDQPQQSPYREWKELALQKFTASGVDIRLAGDFGDHVFAGGVEWAVDALRLHRYRLLFSQLSLLARRQRLPELLHDTALRRPFSRFLGRVKDHSERLAWLREPYARAIRERLDAEQREFACFPRPQHCALLTNAAAAFDASGEHWFLQRHGLEQRMPFRDLALTRWCLSLPADFSQRNGQRKWMLREAMRGLLPEALRMRPKASDLTPVFSRAAEAQQQILARFSATSAKFAASYLVEQDVNASDASRCVISGWLTSSFGAWWDSRHYNN